MKELNVVIQEKVPDICYWPDDFGKIKFLGFQTKSGEKYFRSNWCTTESNSVFWYPLVGGIDALVWTTVHNKTDIEDLLRCGGKFFSFDSAKEMYRWMSGGKNELCD